jgi:hypothetical protein
MQVRRRYAALRPLVTEECTFALLFLVWAACMAWLVLKAFRFFCPDLMSRLVGSAW